MSSAVETLRELLAKATPGPWKVHDCGQPRYIDRDDACGIVSTIEKPTPWSSKPLPLDVMTSDARDECSHPIGKYDAALIVDAINALPALLDVAEAAEGGMCSARRGLENHTGCRLCLALAALAKLGSNKPVR